MRGVLFALLCLSGPVLGQVQQLGDGRDGVLEVTTLSRVINAATALAADAAAGDPFVLVADSTPFSSGAVVLLLQSQWRSDGERYRVGEYSLHFVERVVGPKLELATPLNRPWRQGESQAVLVPQFTDVIVHSGTSLVAPAWNGASGGVLALLANGTVRNDGTLSANGAGFRGGAPREIGQAELGCLGEDEAGPRGAERGEGALVGGFGTTFTGRRNNDSGGGGGACAYSGGGGGAGLGEGGQGGFSGDGKRDVGGFGAAALTWAGLLFGGGGGATNGTFGRGRGGGRGGGGVFLRARTLEGAGLVVADGQEGPATDSRFGGGGGAGAGGSVVVEVVEAARCALFANGGAGGAATDNGPGGGGGGGHVSLRAGRVAECPMSVLGGLAGRVPAGDYGAGAGLPGKSSVLEVPPSSSPFPSGPGVTIQRLGCGCGSDAGAVPGLALAFGAMRRRRRERVASGRHSDGAGSTGSASPRSAR
ncbi:MAG: hypothetical protein JNJ54_14330 [Myxococcaceae bacterium]|nr:hypothetical protein [Myxococcaceae bacterium]